MIWELALEGTEPRNVYLNYWKAYTHNDQYLRVRSDVAIGAEPPDERQMRTVILSPGQLTRMQNTRNDFTSITAYMKELYPGKRSRPYPYTHSMWFDEHEPGSAGIVYGNAEAVSVARNWNYTTRVLGGDDGDWIQIEYEDGDLIPTIEPLVGWRRTRALPSPLTACREAFNVASRSWLSFSSFGTIGENYFNPKSDSLVLTGHSVGYSSNQILSCLLCEDREKVQKLAVLGSKRESPTLHEYRDLGYALACFGNVKEVFLFHWDVEPTELKGEVDINLYDPVPESGWSAETTKNKNAEFWRGLQASWEEYHAGPEGRKVYDDFYPDHSLPSSWYPKHHLPSSWPLPEVIKFMIATHKSASGSG